MKKYLNFSRFVFPVLLAVYIASCGEQQPIDEPLSVTQNQRLTNVSYGTDVRHRMDVFLPANRTSETKLVILIHGGAWVAGDKSIFTSLQDTLLARGIASVNMNYRYVSAKVHSDDLMEDIDKVVQYTIDNAEKWQVGKNKIVIGGHSAGAHMALMYGYTADKRNVIGGIINVSGPTNLYSEELLSELKNSPAAQVQILISAIQYLADATFTPGQPIHDNFRKVSPITRIKNVPTLIIHGTNDELVAYSTALAFEAELKKENVTHKMMTLDGADHTLMNISLPKRVEMHGEMAAWINSYGK